MKRNKWLIMTLFLLFLAILLMRSHQHPGPAFPDKPVWKELSINDLLKLDTLFINWNNHNRLVHPNHMVWKEVFLDDSILQKDTQEANAHNRIETKPSLNRQAKMQVANQ